MKFSLSILAALMAASTFAEQYKLKTATSVDIVEDGEVTGFKTLKGGTLIEVPKSKTDKADPDKDDCFVTIEKALSIDSGLLIEYHLSQCRQFSPDPFTSSAQTNSILYLERKIQKRIFAAAASKDKIAIHDVKNLIVKDFKLRSEISRALFKISETNRQLSYGQIKQLAKYKSDLTHNLQIVDRANDDRIRLWNEN